MARKLAIVFPGQGSQSVGMLDALAADWPVVAETFFEASQALGWDLWGLIREGPKESLDQTQRTQPAMLAAGVAVWRVWLAADGARPDWMAGHSLGELTALVCAGALDFASAVRLVAERARLMQEAVPEGAGAMAAVLGLADDEVRVLCAAHAQGEVLEPVNFNAPGQVVIAGQRAAVERAVAAAKGAGAKRALVLPVSVPSHCALMRPAADGFAQMLHAVQIRAPEIPVLHNVSAAPAAAEDIPRLLAEQLASPVRWVEIVKRIADEGATAMLEAGPGKVLAGLVKRIDKRLDAFAVADPAGLASALEDTRDA
jgi:[acyl-carrier-protein] S-malonyltransferase